MHAKRTEPNVLLFVGLANSALVGIGLKSPTAVELTAPTDFPLCREPWLIR